MDSERARRRACSPTRAVATFFVSTWAEAAALGQLPDGAELCVLHGVGPEDLAAALVSSARPVLNTPEQIARWKEAASGRPCDVMVDTGMNRLGLRTEEIHLIEGLNCARCTAISPAPTKTAR